MVKISEIESSSLKWFVVSLVGGGDVWPGARPQHGVIWNFSSLGMLWRGVNHNFSLRVLSCMAKMYKSLPNCVKMSKFPPWRDQNQVFRPRNSRFPPPRHAFSCQRQSLEKKCRALVYCLNFIFGSSWIGVNFYVQPGRPSRLGLSLTMGWRANHPRWDTV